MKTIAWGILVAALACGAACARPDWIEQTLVTVDVTGTWVGSEPGASYELILEQQGPTVRGSVRRTGNTVPGRPGDRDLSGPIEGTLAGDVFSFRQTNGPLTGETTVGGDEMTGQLSYHEVRTITLRRVSSPSHPRSKEP
jgi:hypothetical protein